MVLKRQPYDLVARHAINEHGLITAREAAKNAESMKHVGEIISRYPSDPTNPKAKKILITTKETWTETVISVE